MTNHQATQEAGEFADEIAWLVLALIGLPAAALGLMIGSAIQ